MNENKIIYHFKVILVIIFIILYYCLLISKNYIKYFAKLKH